MNFTTDFSKALKWICIISLLILIPMIWLQYLEIYGYTFNEVVSNSKIFFNLVINLIPLIIFWLGVSYVSKDKKASLIGFSIELLGRLVFVYMLLSKGVEYTFTHFSFWNFLIFSILSLLAFGWIHFKRPIGLLLGLVAIVSSGIGAGFYSNNYHELIEKLLGIIHLEDILEVRISTGENSYRIIKPFYDFLRQVLHPLLFIVFWFIYSTIKEEKRIDISLRTITHLEYFNKHTYALVHWVLRIVIVAVMFGSLKFLSRMYNQEFDWKNVIRIINFCVAIYVVASIYRNVLLSFYISKKTYPSWFYIFLNIPVLHFIPWTYLFFKTPHRRTIVPDENILDDVEAKDLVVSNAVESQKVFVRDGKNNGLKVFLIIVIIFSGIIQLAGETVPMMNIPAQGQMLVALFLVVSMVLTLWYMSDSKALYPIYIIQSLAIIAAIVFKNEIFIGITAMAGLVNLVIYYPLFHYDKMIFKNISEEEGEE